jgi:hypothetical protein
MEILNVRKASESIYIRGTTPIICRETGVVFNGHAEAAHYYNCISGTIKNHCSIDFKGFPSFMPM